MSEPPTIVTPELEQLAGSQEADDMLDIVVELEQDPAAAQSVEQMQESFGRMKEPVDRTISELGGTVMGEAWINHTLRARIPARGLPDLSQVATVWALDVPHKLEAD